MKRAAPKPEPAKPVDLSRNAALKSMMAAGMTRQEAELFFDVARDRLVRNATKH